MYVNLSLFGKGDKVTCRSKLRRLTLARTLFEVTVKLRASLKHVCNLRMKILTQNTFYWIVRLNGFEMTCKSDLRM
jgi:hypothetical protein